MGTFYVADWNEFIIRRCVGSMAIGSPIIRARTRSTFENRIFGKWLPLGFSERTLGKHRKTRGENWGPRPDLKPRRSEPSKSQCSPTARSSQARGTKSQSYSFSPRAKSKRGPVSYENLHSQQDVLLMKIHGILKGLPRELRQEMIQGDFSQKQRLLLEKWMTTPRQRTSNTCHSVTALVDTIGVNQSAHDLSAANKTDVSELVIRKSGVKRKRKATVMRGICTFASKNYGARIMLDQVLLSSKESDLPTAVENLVIFTAMKQKMLDSRGNGLSFEDRLREAWISSSREHGKAPEELGLRFKFVFTFFYFIGQNDVRSPTVYSIEDLRRFRDIMGPFHAGAKFRGGGKRGHLWHYSPIELELLWQPSCNFFNIFLWSEDELVSGFC